MTMKFHGTPQDRIVGHCVLEKTRLGMVRRAMNQNLLLSLNRADELLAELLQEYETSLHNKSVSPKAVHLTHEVCERLRSVLDRVARQYWEQHIAPDLSEQERAAVSVYFPIATDQNGFDSVLGRWRWRSIRDRHQPLYEFFLALQPFQGPQNRWLAVLNDLAVQGKHIDLVPQTRVEERRTTVSGHGGSVSWGPGVVFSGGVSVMGAPVDPGTQRIIKTPSVTDKVEVWVNFVIDGHGVNAAGFCQSACKGTRQLVTEMTEQFGLSLRA